MATKTWDLGVDPKDWGPGPNWDTMTLDPANAAAVHAYRLSKGMIEKFAGLGRPCEFCERTPFAALCKHIDVALEFSEEGVNVKSLQVIREELHKTMKEEAQKFLAINDQITIYDKVFL